MTKTQSTPFYTLRPYQQDSVDATIRHFQKDNKPAVIVLPTGAGKSLVIAELARVARGRVLVLAHVKELVEQNHGKYESYALAAGIFSAGLNRKDSGNKVIFGSIQSVANAEDEFFSDFSLLVIDECHRVSTDGETQYLQVITKLKNANPKLCILGLTATPYRMGMGWIYRYHLPKKEIKTEEERFFNTCIFELTIGFMIKNKFLTPPIKIDSPVACYDFSTLKMKDDKYSLKEIESVLKDQSRITPVIIANIIEMAKEREGVMIFTSSVSHAREILKLLPVGNSAMVVGETDIDERDEILIDFKKKIIKYLVNVSVLTTGFDAPHVDVIAILRPTESVSLYQQIIGRGLRLSPGKVDCLILDYTGVGHDIFSPEIEDDKPNSKSVVVDIECPQCRHINNFWGIKDEEGELIEHYGRKCKGALQNEVSGAIEMCGFRFRFKRCDQCGEENDIAARVCSGCKHILVDNDTKLKEAMSLKYAHIMRPDTMLFQKGYDKKSKEERLEVRYYDLDGEFLTEYFYLNTPESSRAFYYNFIRMHNRLPETKLTIRSVDEALGSHGLFRMPMFVIARKQKFHWEIREKIFDI
jgi:DNA repair protein RadD